MRKCILIACACALMLVVFCGCATTSSSSSQNGQSAASTSQQASASAERAASYTVTRVEQAPDWSTIPQLDISNVQWTDDYGIRAHAQLCYDDTALYVHMWADEQDVRATYTADDPLPKCYEDSCLEMFIAPEANDARYLNFEFNPNCALCCEIGVEKANRVKLIPADGTFAATSSLTEGGWEITYQVPFDFIRELYPGFSAQSGTEIRGNFYKCGNLTTNKHYLTWNPVDSDTPNFHVPSSFGTLVFE